MEGSRIPPGKSDPAKINRQWSDEDVLPPVLSVDTEFVFDRMTVETLRAAGTENGARVLDVGCGRAIDAVSLARNGSHLFGCEPSRVMLQKAREWLAREEAQVVLVGGIAEDLPFGDGIFQRVVCKGAIDHFMNPQKAVAEMCRVACPGGRVVLSVANFESLSCRLGRWLDRLHRRITGRALSGPHIWEIPADHTYKFGHASTLALARRNLSGISVRGVSLLWGFPHWPGFLKGIPRPAALRILKLLDRIAAWRPAWSDVLIVTGRPLKKFPHLERKEKNG
jgi:ubiquinone/menaquinone biosynthesis C-methylase UbiE